MIEPVLMVFQAALSALYSLWIVAILLPRKSHEAGFGPPVSVIIPAHNEDATIRKTIESVLSQDYAAEIIVVDDGSLDDTARIVGDMAASEDAQAARWAAGSRWTRGQSRRFRGACRDYRLHQEFITPYTPEQNGLIERFVRSLKEECVWQHNFPNFSEARPAIGTWIRWYDEGRPHQALGYRSPQEFRAYEASAVAASGSTIDMGALSRYPPGAPFVLQQLNPVA